MVVTWQPRWRLLALQLSFHRVALRAKHTAPSSPTAPANELDRPAEKRGVLTKPGQTGPPTDQPYFMRQWLDMHEAWEISSDFTELKKDNVSRLQAIYAWLPLFTAIVPETVFDHG